MHSLIIKILHQSQKRFVHVEAEAGSCHGRSGSESRSGLVFEKLPFKNLAQLYLSHSRNMISVYCFLCNHSQQRIGANWQRNFLSRQYSQVLGNDSKRRPRGTTDVE